MRWDSRAEAEASSSVKILFAEETLQKISGAMLIKVSVLLQLGLIALVLLSGPVVCRALQDRHNRENRQAAEFSELVNYPGTFAMPEASVRLNKIGPQHGWKQRHTTRTTHSRM